MQRRVGVIGGVRIPFCRNNTTYADVGNFGMSVKVLGSLVERYGLHGVELGEVAVVVGRAQCAARGAAAIRSRNRVPAPRLLE